MWRLKIFESRSGVEILDVTELVSESTWTARLNGQGDATHTLRLGNSGLSAAQVTEITRGNKYTIAQLWDGVPVYAGVIADDDWDEDTSVLTVTSKEIRAYYGPGRMTVGVNQFDPAATALEVVNRSRSGAVRAVLQAIMAPSSEWVLPIDLPADGAGGFTARWRQEEKLTWGDLLDQIEADGCEILFRPQIVDGLLRWQTVVAVKVQTGTPADLIVKSPESIVVGLKVKRSSDLLATGVLGFGKGQGQDTPFAFAPQSGSGASDQPVRDVVVSFPDIEVRPGNATDQKRLQDATNAEYERRRSLTEQWSFSLMIADRGPTIALPGMALRLWVYGSARIPDGPYSQRVAALAGGWNTTVTPEVQSG